MAHGDKGLQEHLMRRIALYIKDQKHFPFIYDSVVDSGQEKGTSPRVEMGTVRNQNDAARDHDGDEPMTPNHRKHAMQFFPKSSGPRQCWRGAMGQSVGLFLTQCLHNIRAGAMAANVVRARPVDKARNSSSLAILGSDQSKG